MINQAMKNKLMRNNHDLENFKSDLNSDIGKSLSILAKSRPPESQDRNFMGEFRSLLKTGNDPISQAHDPNENVKRSYMK